MIGIVKVVDGQWLIRYDTLGLKEESTGKLVAEILGESACHGGGHLWIGKHVLCEDEEFSWEGTTDSNYGYD